MFLKNENRKVSLKKITLLILILSLIQPSFVMADTHYTDVPKTHWIKPILDHLVENQVVEPTSIFNLGSALTKEEWLELIQISLLDKSKVEVSKGVFDTTHKITRIEALELLVSQMGLDGVLESIKNGSTRFIDVEGYDALLQLSEDLGWVAVNATKTFRPNAVLTKEESYALLYNVYNAQSFKFDVLHSYYAISSFGQIGFSKDLTALSYGWGR